MKEEILDNINLKKDSIYSLHRIIPTLILCSNVLYPILTDGDQLSIINWINTGLLLLSILLFFIQKEIWLKLITPLFFLWIIILDSFQLTFHWQTGIYYGDIFIGIDFPMLILFLLHYVFNIKYIDQIISAHTSPVKANQTRLSEASIKGFERRFENNSDDNLKSMLNAGLLTPEAIEAARRIKKKRNASINPKQ